MCQLVTIGETMVSFVPQNSEPLQYGPSLKMRIAGAESNTAIGLTKLGHSAAFISCIGADSLGLFLLRMLRAEGVETAHIKTLSDSPTGIMFKESLHGETSISYFRTNSAATNMVPEDIPEKLFEDSKIFHFTGITPILSESCNATIHRAIELAIKNNCKISFDPNIRQKLWKNKNHIPLMKDFIKQSHYLMIGLEEANMLYGEYNYNDLVSLLFESENLEMLAIKDGANGAYVSNGQEIKFIPPYNCNCIDPVGAGDAFNAGFLAGLIRGESFETAGRMGAISGAHATETRGDIEGLLTSYELSNILNGRSQINR